MKEIRDVVALINGTAEVELTTKCRVGLDRILGRMAYASEAAAMLDSPSTDHCAHAHTELHKRDACREHNHGLDRTVHLSQVGTVSLSLEAPLDSEKWVSHERHLKLECVCQI